MTAIKVIHILCVMGWMTSIFAVPRALIYWKREYARIGEFGPTGDLAFRLYRFSAGLAVIGVVTGIWMAHAYWDMAVWTWAKLALVAVLTGYYIVLGFMVRRAKQGIFRESDTYLRVFNESSILIVIAILWVVVAKPF
ncbi:MAG: hypothetical protein CR993_07865 [Rhodobacterales bacterium]|nr:MAG: hypothetical protein CR993_07865 [Rhodobacterales bacterium]